MTVALVVLVLGFPFEGEGVLGLSYTFLAFVVLLHSFVGGLPEQSIVPPLTLTFVYTDVFALF